MRLKTKIRKGIERRRMAERSDARRARHGQHRRNAQAAACIESGATAPLHSRTNNIFYRLFLKFWRFFRRRSLPVRLDTRK